MAAVATGDVAETVELAEKDSKARKEAIAAAADQVRVVRIMPPRATAATAVWVALAAKGEMAATAEMGATAPISLSSTRMVAHFRISSWMTPTRCPAARAARKATAEAVAVAAAAAAAALVACLRQRLALAGFKAIKVRMETTARRQRMARRGSSNTFLHRNRSAVQTGCILSAPVVPVGYRLV